MLRCILLATGVLLMVGCNRVPEHTLDPVALSNDFANYDAGRVQAYRMMWEGKALTEMDRAMLAGELLGKDPDRGGEYLSYLEGAVRSRDEVIAAAAAYSLRNADEEGALDLLVELAVSPSTQVARSAAEALAFKRQNIVGRRMSGREAEALYGRIKQLCGRPSIAGYVREVVCK